MKIKRLVIENFKSIERIELVEPNPFTVFVGPNGSGKSNIFEALEFVNLKRKISKKLLIGLFGGADNFLNFHSYSNTFHFECEFQNFISVETSSHLRDLETTLGITISDKADSVEPTYQSDYQQFYESFARIFVRNINTEKFSLSDEQALSSSASNLEKVLKRVLKISLIKREISEWLELFVPSFKAVEVDDRDELHWFENSSDRYFTKDLISDGTYNILALLTAVYQSDDKPQFLCIEEPENGLHPQVARELVDFFRLMCEERGHYIWLNTHSPYMVSRVRPEELVVVDKVNGATQVKQFKSGDFEGMRMDDAWLTNVLNGGKAW